MRQLFKFALIGLVATVIHVSIVICVVETVSLKPWLSNGIAFIIASLFSYTCNTLWSFDTALSVPTIKRYYCVSFVGLSLSISLSAIVEYYSIHYFYGIFLVVCLVPLVSFYLHKCWTFKYH